MSSSLERGAPTPEGERELETLLRGINAEGDVSQTTSAAPVE
ncbi:hypothetical protein [Rhodococcus sp. 06-418-5]|nr:hypothetical protein [Rhodococcus sp. 06-418-5]